MMKLVAALFILFGIIIIVNPDIIAYLVGGLLVFIGINMLFIGLAFKKKTPFSKENYVKFGKYKIFR